MIPRAMNKVREARAEQDWTQGELARIAGISIDTVVRAEKGERMSALSQARLARALDIARSELFPEEVSA